MTDNDIEQLVLQTIVDAVKGGAADRAAAVIKRVKEALPREFAAEARVEVTLETLRQHAESFFQQIALKDVLRDIAEQVKARQPTRTEVRQ